MDGELENYMQVETDFQNGINLRIKKNQAEESMQEEGTLTIEGKSNSSFLAIGDSSFLEVYDTGPLQRSSATVHRRKSYRGDDRDEGTIWVHLNENREGMNRGKDECPSRTHLKILKGDYQKVGDLPRFCMFGYTGIELKLHNSA
ncbi:hypothetical protein HAX54_030154 [Datura stramonium]|uniref:Uncharacterized protein n=1 Tax=Datura stramonium TaxID=4076 RepID=A0ABS8V7A0_DATST|nr:hypothetical protein [Datura stramonium]